MAKKVRKKKISYQDPKFTHMLIQKELDFHGVKLEDIIKLDEQKIDGVEWRQHYTFKTPEQYEEWKQFCIQELMNSTENLSESEAIQLFIWVDFTFGLRQEYLEEKLVNN